MELRSLLFYTPSTIMIMFALAAILVKNPFYSVLSLAVSFLSAAIMMFGQGMQFIPLVLIIIYVGAIIVLFLFVVMMVDYKSLITDSSYIRINKIAMPFIILFVGTLFFFIVKSLKDNNVSEDITGENLLQIGNIIYNELSEELLYVALLLLIGVIGAVALTKEFIHHPSKRSFVSEQLKRKRQDSIEILTVESGKGVEY